MEHNINAAVCTGGTGRLMDGELTGARFSCFTAESETELSFSPCDCFSRVLLVLSGEVEASSAPEGGLLRERDVYVQAPMEALAIRARKRALLLEVLWDLTREEFEAYCGTDLPLAVAYEKAPTYRETCKSEKTVSRMLIPARTIPRLAMGSVETAGDDQVEKHTHPMVEQFFLGLSDNHCSLIIDGVSYPFGPYTLLHIPLGSEHGVLSKEDQKVHYVWIDFLLGEEGLAYMDQAHKMNQET